MRRGWLRLAVATGCVLLAGGAAAQSEDPARAGLYVGVAGSYAFEDFDLGGLEGEDGFGLEARVGYRANPWIAYEVELEYLPGVDIDALLEGDLDLFVLTANLRILAPLGRAQPFVCVGAGALQSDVSLGGVSERDTDLALRIGGGVDVSLTEHLTGVLGAGYVVPTGDVGDFDFGSITWGIQYRF